MLAYVACWGHVSIKPFLEDIALVASEYHKFTHKVQMNRDKIKIVIWAKQNFVSCRPALDPPHSMWFSIDAKRNHIVVLFDRELCVQSLHERAAKTTKMTRNGLIVVLDYKCGVAG